MISSRLRLKGGIWFFHAGQKGITLGKIREYFTSKSIQLLEHDGYIKVTERVKMDEKDRFEKVFNSSETKKIYATYVAEEFNKDSEYEFDASHLIKGHLIMKRIDVVEVTRTHKEGDKSDKYTIVAKDKEGKPMMGTAIFTLDIKP
jgi:hypothetical protein